MKDEGILAKRIYESRKAMGVTQEILAERLGITPQSISRWENGQSRPDVDMLPKLAAIFGTTVDALFGYHAENIKITLYEEKYKKIGCFWGGKIRRLAREILGLLPPDKPRTVLEVGCGDGQAAVFFARNGYIVSAFDIDDIAINNAKKLADEVGVNVNFFRADLTTYKIESQFDVIYSSGVMHYVPSDYRQKFFDMLQANTAVGGLNALNTLVDKSFASDFTYGGEFYKSAELFSYYGRDWKFEMMDEVCFERDTAEVTNHHCIDIMIARKITE